MIIKVVLASREVTSIGGIMKIGPVLVKIATPSSFFWETCVVKYLNEFVSYIYYSDFVEISTVCQLIWYIYVDYNHVS